MEREGSYDTVLLRHIYSVLIENTFSKVHCVLYMFKSSLCYANFRVKSIYIGFFFKFLTSMALVYTFTDQKICTCIQVINLKRAVKFQSFDETV